MHQSLLAIRSPIPNIAALAQTLSGSYHEFDDAKKENGPLPAFRRAARFVDLNASMLYFRRVYSITIIFCHSSSPSSAS
jgi:hypothetical protein